MWQRAKAQTLILLASAVFTGLAAFASKVLQPLLSKRMSSPVAWLCAFAFIFVAGVLLLAMLRGLWLRPIEDIKSWKFLGRTVVGPKVRLDEALSGLREDFHPTSESIDDHRDNLEHFLEDMHTILTRGCLEEFLYQGRPLVIATALRGMVVVLQRVYDGLNRTPENEAAAEAMRTSAVPVLEQIAERLEGYWQEILTNLSRRDGEFLTYLVQKRLVEPNNDTGKHVGKPIK